MYKLVKFYDLFHIKNKFFYKLISKNNFTYFYILKLLENYGVKNCENKLILDVGCGVGSISLYLANKKAKVVGIDISKRAIAIANKAKKYLKLNNIEFYSGELAKGKNKFDIVICSEVLEHIKDDDFYLKLIYSHIKKNGLLFLTIPSKENLVYKLGLYKEFDKNVGHFRRYSTKTIINLLQTNGFKIIKIQNVESILRNFLFVTKFGFLIKFIKGPLVPIFHFFDGSFIKLFGASDIQIVAKKI